MVDHEHASRYTADMFMAPRSAVALLPGLSPLRHPVARPRLLRDGDRGVRVGSPRDRDRHGAVPARDGRPRAARRRPRVPQLRGDAGAQLLLPGGARRAGARVGVPGRGPAPPVQPDRAWRCRGASAPSSSGSSTRPSSCACSTPSRRSERSRRSGGRGPRSWATSWSRSTAWPPACATAATLPDRPATSQLVAQACELLERDPAHPWTLAELSARLYVGPFHLARQFVKAMGMPPMHYLARWRAERAAGMLAATDDPVAAVGAAVGWADPSQFSRRFRAVFGVSPREYRRRVRDGHAPVAEAVATVAQAS